MLSVGLLMLHCIQCDALSLPKNLSNIDGRKLSTRFGFQSIQRVNGPANSVGVSPGLFPGVELLFIIPPDENLGEGGQLTAFMPVPRLFVTKGFPYAIDVQLHFFPWFIMPQYHSYGGSVKWTALTEENFYTHLAVKGGVTWAGFVSNGVSTLTGTLNVLASRDFVMFMPYVGIGAVYTMTSVKKEFMEELRDMDFSKLGLHAFLGLQVRLAVTFNIELGYSGDQFYAGLSIGKNFYDEFPVVDMPATAPPAS